MELTSGGLDLTAQHGQELMDIGLYTHMFPTGASRNHAIAFWRLRTKGTTTMNQSMKLQTGSSPTTTNWTEVQSPSVDAGNVVHTSKYHWSGKSVKSNAKTTSVEALIQQFSIDSEFRDGLKQGRQEIAKEYYSGENSIRALRLKAGISQKELAEMIETKQPAIARYESGQTLPSLPTIDKLSVALGVEFVDLCVMLK